MEAQELMILIFAYDKCTLWLKHGKSHALAAHLPTIFTSALSSAAVLPLTAGQARQHTTACRSISQADWHH